MAWKYGFFDPVEVEPGVYDREYNSEEFSRPFSALIDTGVLQGAGGELEVTADGISMDTTIASGIAFINGRFAENIGTVTHTHDTESVEVDRIDRIVIRLDLRPETRSMESYIKKGVASENPSPPALQRDQYVYEISLAQVYIKGGQSYIEQADITDERGDDTLCPWARSKVLPSYDQQDLDNLQQDFDAHLADYETFKDEDYYPFKSSKGMPNGLAELDEAGNIPESQLGNIPKSEQVWEKILSMDLTEDTSEIRIDNIGGYKYYRIKINRLKNTEDTTGAVTLRFNDGLSQYSNPYKMIRRYTTGTTSHLAQGNDVSSLQIPNILASSASIYYGYLDIVIHNPLSTNIYMPVSITGMVNLQDGTLGVTEMYGLYRLYEPFSNLVITGNMRSSLTNIDILGVK